VGEQALGAVERGIVEVGAVAASISLPGSPALGAAPAAVPRASSSTSSTAPGRDRSTSSSLPSSHSATTSSSAGGSSPGGARSCTGAGAGSTTIAGRGHTAIAIAAAAAHVIAGTSHCQRRHHGRGAWSATAWRIERSIAAQSGGSPVS